MNAQDLRWLGATLALATSVMVGLAGCKDTTGCESNDECRDGRICIQGRCVPEPGADTGEADTGQPDTGRPETGQGDTGLQDTGIPDDTSIPRDTGEDTGVDTGSDIGVDTGVDTSVDTGADTGLDTGFDTSVDTGRDTGVDTGMDTGVDSGTDTGVDTGMDTGPPVGPQIRLTPPGNIDFGGVLVNKSSSQDVVLENVGDQPLTISKFALRRTPSTGFSLSGPSIPLTIAPGASSKFTVTFKPPRQARYRNYIDITTNDQDDGSPEIQLDGQSFDTVGRPCLFSTPDALDFGTVQPGGTTTRSFAVGNCSRNDTVTVTAFNFLSNQANSFKIAAGAPKPPFQVKTGQTKTIQLEFAPSSRKDVTGRLEIRSDERNAARDLVDLKGSGGGCASAVALGRTPSLKGDKNRGDIVPVPPMSFAEFDASQSTSPSGQLRYRWTVTQRPSGSNAALTQATTASPRLTPDKVGYYRVKLEVWDAASGQKACNDDSIRVVATKKSPEVELSVDWRADHNVDLHLLRSDTMGNFGKFGTGDDVFPGKVARDWQPRDMIFDAFHLGDARSGGGNTARKSESIVLSGLDPQRKYRVAAHFKGVDGNIPPFFNAEITANVLTTNTGPQTERHRFVRFRDRDVGKYWIAFEIDGKTGQITKVDREVNN